MIKIGFLVMFVFLLVGCGNSSGAAQREPVEIDFATFPPALLQDFADKCHRNAQISGFFLYSNCDVTATLVMDAILRPIYQEQLSFCLDCNGAVVFYGMDGSWLSVMYHVNVERMDLQYEGERIRDVFTALKKLPTDFPIGIWVTFRPTDADAIHYYFLTTHDIIGYDVATYDFVRHFIEDDGSIVRPD